MAAPVLAARAGPAAVGYVNGQVYTSTGWASAIAVVDGKIVAIGDTPRIKRSLPKNAVVVDLAGRAVFPSFLDLHVHGISAGKTLGECKFMPDADIDAIAAAVAECSKKAAPGAWIFGSAWSRDAAFVKSFDKGVLDRAAPRNPVALFDTTGHNAIANSRALSIAGISRNSADPSNGHIEKGASGEPTGVLIEEAAGMVRFTLPAASIDDARDSLGAALSVLASYGVTAMMDASAKTDELNGYRALADAGRLKLRVRECLLWNDQADFERLYRSRKRFERDRIKVDCVKIFMDGVPNESRSAAMLAPYVAADGAADGGRGRLFVDLAKLAPKVAEWDRDGVTVKFHAAGDLAVREAMNLVELARKTNGPRGPVHEIAHNPFMAPEDIERATPLGVALEFSPVHWYPDGMSTSMAAVTGLQRSARVWPAREALAAGAFSYAASDWPAVDTPSPWVAIETLVTRRQPGGGGRPYGENESVSLEQAIDMYTRSAARAFGRSGGQGVIRIGAPANLVIIDRNPFSIPITQVHRIKTLRTIADGEVIYDSGELMRGERK